MALRQIIELANAQIEVEERSGYLYVVETGQLRNVRELSAYTTAMDDIVAKSGIDKAIIDARGEVGDPPVEVRTGMWDWLMSPDRGFTLVAFILPSEMSVARVNMTALSRRAPVRAFESVQEAQRWLTRGPRTSSLMAQVSGTDRSSSRPPPIRADGEALAPTERPPAGPVAASSFRPAPSLPARPRPPSDDTFRAAAPTKPAEPRRPSDRGFRAPTPGPVERAARTQVQAPSDRVTRESEVRSRSDERDPAPSSSGRPPKGGGAKGGSQVA